jgi:hypothetical protein
MEFDNYRIVENPGCEENLGLSGRTAYRTHLLSDEPERPGEYLLALISDVSLATAFAQYLFSAFMSAFADSIGGLPGETRW